jgi:TatD DNase family protein
VKDKWRKILPLMCDTHCHVDDYPFPDQLRDSVEHDQMKVHLMTQSPEQFVRIQRERGDGSSEGLHLALGLIPQEVAERQAEIDSFFEHLPGTRLIGEVGLDFVTECKEDRALQQQFFRRVLDAAAGKIVSIHSRRAASEVIAMLNDFGGTAILHWFSGSLDDVRNASRLPKVYFSVNTAMISSRRGKELIRVMPRDRMLLESDGPYIQYQQRPVEPRDLISVISFFAGEWEVSAHEAAEMIQDNYRRACRI